MHFSIKRNIYETKTLQYSEDAISKYYGKVACLNMSMTSTYQLSTLQKYQYANDINAPKCQQRQVNNVSMSNVDTSAVSNVNTSTCQQ